MTPERWRQIEELYHRALELEESRRAAFLQEACAGDRALQDEVGKLLAEERPTASYDAATQLGPGAQLGSYRIEALIGAGGMGDVFCAVDTRLGRKVAIKVSAQQFTRRFDREARVISALNHPHICTLYDVGPNYFVMELVEGENLAARLKKGPLPMQLVLRYGEQIADALAAAHAQGITHRDLKPANIMVTKSGVKVLDFGLAKITRPVGAPKQSESLTALTAPEAVMGTLGYMAPEQLEGKDSDARSDIFSLGLVLYEMATGRKVFSGDSQAALIADVMRCQPAPMESVPEKFTHVVERSLARDPEDRWQTAKDVKAELSWAGTHQPPQAPARKASARLAWGITALACAALIAAGIATLRRAAAPSPERPAQFTLSFAAQMDLDQPNGMPIPSPDGQYFAFIGSGSPNAGPSLWIRPLDSVEATMLQGTDGAQGAVIWSPDGRWVAFYADGKLKKVSPLGGPPQTIAELPGFQDASWGSYGDIIYRSDNRDSLFVIPESGGSSRQVTQLDRSLTENSHRGPEFLPDGRRFLFTTRCGQRANNALYVGSLDSPKLKRLMPAESNVSYVPPRADRLGALLYYRDGALISQPFDPDSETLTGDPVPVMDKVGYNPPSIQAFFEVSADGRVAIIRPAGAGDTRLTWFSRSGEETGVVGPPGQYLQPRISPNGDRVTYTRPDDQTGNRDVWYTEIVRGITSRLTVNVANDWFPVWSPDGRQILFGSDRGGGIQVPTYLKKSMDPGSDESPVPEATGSPYDWSRDGRWISYGNNDLWVAPTSGDRTPFQFLATPFQEDNGRFSPDAKWIAYVSNESGRYEVYIRPFAGAPTAEEKIQISNNGGDFPVWGPTGQEIFYMSGDSDVYAVSTSNIGQSATVPLPSRLFRACPAAGMDSPPASGRMFGYAYDTHDGERFLVNCFSEPPGRFVVLMNWAGPR